MTGDLAARTVSRRVGTGDFEVVVVASSAGGVRALMQLVESIPASFSIPVVVVQHLDPRHPSLLVDILSRHAHLPVEQARTGTRLDRAVIVVAPPGSHVVVDEDRTLSLSHAAPVHFVRPSADLLFESASAVFGPRVIAVVLTGTGEDGANGVHRVKSGGGVVLVQDEESSEFFGMPSAAIATGDVDRILPLQAVGPALVELSVAGRPS